MRGLQTKPERLNYELLSQRIIMIGCFSEICQHAQVHENWRKRRITGKGFHIYPFILAKTNRRVDLLVGGDFARARVLSRSTIPDRSLKSCIKF